MTRWIAQATKAARQRLGAWTRSAARWLSAPRASGSSSYTYGALVPLGRRIDEEPR